MNRTRHYLRRLRQSLLFLVLLVVSVWGYLNHRADHHVFAWDRELEILLVPLVDPATDLADGGNAELMRRFLSVAPGGGTLALERWFEDEYARHVRPVDSLLRIAVESPSRVASLPPPIPDLTDSFVARWRKTAAFLEYFEDLDREHRLLQGAFDATLFVYFYDPERRSTFVEHHPVATRRRRFGVVFVPLELYSGGFYSALLAHELCHAFGATDKYAGGTSVFPEGFAEPQNDPLYPQRHAEIMALGIPVASGVERRVESLSDCVVGDTTAREMGWLPPLE